MQRAEAIAWVRTLVEEHPETVLDPQGFLKHVGQVYDTAEEVTRKITTLYPRMPLQIDEVALAAGLHDIGRPLSKDQLFHELRGAAYLEREAIGQGAVQRPLDVYRLAQMIRSHGFVYEFWNDPDHADQRTEFKPLEACLLVPRTWQESIVTYSDLASYQGQRVKVEDRLREILHRYETDERYRNGAVLRATREAEPRILDLAARVEALEAGKLSEGDIARYGFL